jgi:hypothetical protein
MTTHMPHRFEKSAPRFDPTNPRSLRRYFADLDDLFIQHNVSDDQQKKRHATKYLDIEAEDFWRVIPEYKPPASFETFRARFSSTTQEPTTSTGFPTWRN